ncbi:Glutathione S-transferase zeta class [Bienertia sinuspersici]
MKCLSMQCSVLTTNLPLTPSTLLSYQKINSISLEKLLAGHAGKYATGDEVALADLFLAPQIGGAIKRFNIDMAEYPILKRLNDAYSEHPAFQNAVPVKQPDAPDNAKP